MFSWIFIIEIFSIIISEFVRIMSVMIYAETAMIEGANISSNPMDLEKGFGRESG